MINEKVITLQTSLENTKTDLAYIHKSKKQVTNDKENVEKELESVKKTLSLKEEKVEDFLRILKDISEQVKNKDDLKNAFIHEKYIFYEYLS